MGRITMSAYDIRPERPAIADVTTHRPAKMFLTVPEVADLLRTSRKAIYSMVERGQLAGVVRIGRRVLVQQAHLLEWVRQKSAPSLER